MLKFKLVTSICIILTTTTLAEMSYLKGVIEKVKQTEKFQQICVVSQDWTDEDISNLVESKLHQNWTTIVKPKLYLSELCFLAEKNSLIIFHEIEPQNRNVMETLLKATQQNLANNLWFILTSNSTAGDYFFTHRRKLGLQSLIFFLDTNDNVLVQIKGTATPKLKFVV
jgi:hypothetical protein